MRTVNEQNFGLLIAYVLPGWVALIGVAELVETVEQWLGSTATESTVGGFLYSTLSSLGLGLAINTIRQMIVDGVLTACRISSMHREYQVLQQNLEAVEFLVLNQFRYHQFHGNMAIALIFSISTGMIKGSVSMAMVAMGLLGIAVSIQGAWICLRTYYRRIDEVLGSLDATRDKP